jgi:hypothetical protein
MQINLSEETLETIALALDWAHAYVAMDYKDASDEERKNILQHMTEFAEAADMWGELRKHFNSKKALIS